MATAQQLFRAASNPLRGGPYHEDVLDEIYTITPDDCPFFDTIGDTTARSVWHDWPLRDLSVRQDNAQVEGRVYTIGNFENTVLTTRASNWCQIFARLPRVTGTQEAMDPVGISNLLADQVMFHEIGIKTDYEHALLLGTVASGGSGATKARRLQGALAAAAYNTILQSTYTFYEDVFNDFHEKGWQRGARLRDALASPRMKRWISKFTASTTKYVFQEDKKIVNAIDVYESDFYLTRVRLSHDLPNGGGNGRGLFMFDRDMFSKAWLRRPRRRPLSLPSDGMEVELLAEGTLEYGHPQACQYVRARQGNY